MENEERTFREARKRSKGSTMETVKLLLTGLMVCFLVCCCCRASAAVDEGRASALFQDLLLYLEKQWRRSVQENTLLQRPDFLGMRAFLLVGPESCVCSSRGLCRSVGFCGCNLVLFFFLLTV